MIPKAKQVTSEFGEIEEKEQTPEPSSALKSKEQKSVQFEESALETAQGNKSTKLVSQIFADNIKSHLKEEYQEQMKINVIERIEEIREGMEQQKTPDQALQFFDSWLGDQLLCEIQEKMRTAKVVIDDKRARHQAEAVRREAALRSAIDKREKQRSNSMMVAAEELDVAPEDGDFQRLTSVMHSLHTISQIK